MPTGSRTFLALVRADIPVTRGPVRQARPAACVGTTPGVAHDHADQLVRPFPHRMVTLDGFGLCWASVRTLEGAQLRVAAHALEALLRTGQASHGWPSSGACHPCRHFRRESVGTLRGGSRARPRVEEIGKICHEHERPEEESAWAPTVSMR